MRPPTLTDGGEIHSITLSGGFCLRGQNDAPPPLSAAPTRGAYPIADR